MKCRNATTTIKDDEWWDSSQVCYLVSFTFLLSKSLILLIYNRLLRSQSHIQNTYPTLTARKRAQTNSPRYDLIIIYLIYSLFYSQTTCTTTVQHQGKSQTTVFTVVWAEVHLFQVPRHHDAHDAHHVTTSPPRHHDLTTTDHRWPLPLPSV